MKEQIKAIIYKHTYHGGTNGVPLTIDVESIAIEIDKLYQQTYLNECIEKATPNLSKIKDVDKELSEIRGEDKCCENCKHYPLWTTDHPCSICLGMNHKKWEPIK